MSDDKKNPPDWVYTAPTGGTQTVTAWTRSEARAAFKRRLQRPLESGADIVKVPAAA